MTARQTLDDAMSEDELLAAVRKLARLRGWLTYHSLRSEGSEPGFPDLVMVRRGRLLMVEIKTTKGRLSDAQRGWLVELSGCRCYFVDGAAGPEVCVWRPSDWSDGTIEEALR